MEVISSVFWCSKPLICTASVTFSSSSAPLLPDVDVPLYKGNAMVKQGCHQHLHERSASADGYEGAMHAWVDTHLTSLVPNACQANPTQQE